MFAASPRQICGCSSTATLAEALLNGRKAADGFLAANAGPGGSWARRKRSQAVARLESKRGNGLENVAAPPTRKDARPALAQSILPCSAARVASAAHRARVNRRCCQRAAPPVITAHAMGIPKKQQGRGKKSGGAQQVRCVHASPPRRRRPPPGGARAAWRLGSHAGPSAACRARPTCMRRRRWPSRWRTWTPPTAALQRRRSWSQRCATSAAAGSDGRRFTPSREPLPCAISQPHALCPSPPSMHS